MMEEPGTDALRQLAPCWTLEGGERLLTILQSTHQRIISKCQETNSQLEQMVTALDDASVSLQNVNNQFMSLSSSQFIERRVYDDDVDVAAGTPETKEAPKPSPPDELSILKRSIAVIESSHEVITIIHDSDSDTDTDDDAPHRLVMKPKDVYSDRPLPYIIGSDPWKNKWHAGLLVEDSDSDSTVSKPDRDTDQYSQSEPEDIQSVNRDNVHDATAYHPRNLSESSSDVPSEATPPSKPTPADVAREIARRLGGGDLPAQSVEPETEYDEPTKPAVRKIYKPQEPVASTIFPDEPPPLDSTDSDPDIFADLHRKQPYNQPYRGTGTEQLFGGSDTDDGADIFSDFANQPPTKPTSLFEAGPKPNMFNKQPGNEHPSKSQPQTVEQPTRTVEQPIGNAADTDDGRGVKKPVGGISLFGSNKGSEIGAAILKRNQLKSSTSDEESTTESLSQSSPAKEQAKKEKDIFDDLFAKSENKKTKPKVDNVVQDIKQHTQKKNKEIEKKDTPKPVDLFSDNLFDEIDDIFTTSVVKTTDKKPKSIFDDDDDLFSDITETKPVKHEAKDKNDNKKSLFDSDDDLFSDNVAKPSVSNKTQDVNVSNSSPNVNENPIKVIEKPTKIVTPKVNEKSTKTAESAKITKESTSIFDDDDDDIFSNIKTNKEITKVQSVASTGNNNVTKNMATSKDVFKSPSLFDDDDDESDLFTDSVKSKIATKAIDANKVTPKTTIEPEINTLTINKDKTENTNSFSTDNISTKVSNKTEESNTDIFKNSIKPENITIEDEEDIFNQKSRDNIEKNKLNTSIDDVLKENIDNELVERRSSDSSSYSTEPVKEIATEDSLNTNIKTSLIQKPLDDNKEILSDNDFSEPDSQIESLLEIEPEKSSNITVTDTNTSDKPIIATDNKVTEAQTDKHHIIDNRLLEEDIFASPHIIPKTEIPETKTEIDNNSETIPKAAIFTAIVTEPPIFEKPKEPKKSKNVNALFDDDSDDESLFFKKDDIVTDEKPEDFTVKQDSLFDIFTDEPPDVDFSKIDSEIDDDLFSTMPTPEIPTKHTKSNVEVDFKIPVLDETLKGRDNIENVITQNTDNKPEMTTLQEEAVVPQLKGNTDDIVNPEKKTKTLVNKETANIFDDMDDMFKEPISLIGSVTDKRMNLSDDDEELFKSLPVQLPKSKTEIFSKNKSKSEQSDEELFKSLPNIEKSAPKEELSTSTLGRNKSFKLPTEKSRSPGSDAKSDKSEVKKVGKLKVGFNINVNALLPGASPKKVKPVDNIDGQAQSQVEIEKDVPKLIKPVSFDGKPESEVLDNKLSKERPRIQVKRRPSTRKARREAVRKSGIDFGEDSTDNSSSMDDPPKIQTKIAKTVDTKTETTEDKNVNNEEIINKNEVNYLDSPKIESRNIKTDDKPIKTDNNTEEPDNLTKVEPLKQPVKSDSTTKIVYILNDEDIFNTSAVETSETKTITTKNTNREPEFKVTKDVTTDIIKVTEDTNANIALNTGIKTLGSVYKSTKSDENKKLKSLFGEDENSDNDEIFFKNKKSVAKATIFDSESEEELFGSTKKVEKVIKVEKKVERVMKEVKGSLFGDDNDDDDLFGVKTKKIVDPQPAPSRSTPMVKETPKSTQPVFEDPLSMFRDED